MTFQRYNNVIGLLVFVISTAVYTLTLEPSVSFWDCGEWISVGYGLQVGHPPGAPLYVLLAKIFSLPAINNTANVAYCINMLSAVASGLTIMLLFWSTTYFLKQLFSGNKAKIRYPNAVILASGFAGSMAYAFSDTFWFSAIESEVYALSGLFSALMIWCMTKYCRSTSLSYRWIILIFFLIGLSFSVHNLSLLVIPAMVMMYYYHNYKRSIVHSIAALVVSMVLLAVIFLGIIPGFFYLAGETSVWLVNKFNISILGSVVIYLGATAAVFVLSIVAASLFHKNAIKLFIICTLYLVIGLSVQFVSMFCSMAEPVTNEAQPSNPKALYSYIQRDQYEKAPLIYGPYYTAPFDRYADGKAQYDMVYIVENDSKTIDTCHSITEANKYLKLHNDIKITPRYVISNTGQNSKALFDKEFYTIFPRMWKHGEAFGENYYTWTEGKGRFVEIDGKEIYKPSFSDNISFFFNYQLRYMYIRYLMWNFSGKYENISEEDYIFFNQDWITGIEVIDHKFGKEPLSDHEKGPRHNTYFLIPFILGIVGFFFQLYKDTPRNIILSTLFFFTGIAIVIYLNQAAYEPRERDYVYLTSFYTFSVWISMGVASIFHLIQKIKPLQNKKITAVICLLSLSVPWLMGYQNWDDHDRSKQYLPHDLAYNMLQSCAPNAILFTNGDNDTFPLWYLQQVEGIRTDVRIINLSLLASSWYINQIKDQNQANNTVFISFDNKTYRGDRLGTVFSQSSNNITMAGIALEYLKSDSSIIELDDMPIFHIMPFDYLCFDTSAAYIKLPQILSRSGIIHLDIVNNNYDRRPIYYTDYALSEIDFLNDYLQLEGMAYKLVLKDKALISPIDTEVFYTNVMNTFEWGKIENGYVGNTSLEILNLLLENISKLSNSLMENGDTNKAVLLWSHILNNIPQHMIFNTAAMEAALLGNNTLETKK